MLDLHLAHEFLHTRGKPVPRKKWASNTFLERRGDSIAMRLHDTDVVTYHPDGSVVLNTGGWLTSTTMERINRGMPEGWSLRSNSGTWEVWEHGDDGYRWARADQASVYRYRDGLTIRHGNVVPGTFPTPEQCAKDDKHNTAVKKLVARWLKDWDAHGAVSAPNTCVMCRQHGTKPRAMGGTEIVTIGDQMGDTQHLIDHLHQGEVSDNLIRAAVASRGYRVESALVLGTSTVKRCLRSYICNRLLIGSTVPAHGRKPTPTLESAA